MSFYSHEELKNIGFKAIGKNILLSKKTSIYAPDKISIGNNVRIDDFCIISGGEKGIEIGSHVHIAAYCAIYGSGGVVIKDFVGLSARCVIYSASDDYSGDFLTNPTIPKQYLNVLEGVVILNRHAIIGTNSTILPSVIIGEGTAVGAHSLVMKNLEGWSIYFGSPAKRIKKRKQGLLKLEEFIDGDNIV